MPRAQGSADKKVIRRLDQEWGDAASRKDLKATLGFYAGNATLVWPGAPAVHGRAGVTKAWKKMFRTIPGLALRFTPKRIDVRAGLAVDFGRVAFGQDVRKKGVTRHVTQAAKYVVIWKKVGGSWKVLYDCWNANS